MVAPAALPGLPGSQDSLHPQEMRLARLARVRVQKNRGEDDCCGVYRVQDWLESVPERKDISKDEHIH